MRKMRFLSEPLLGGNTASGPSVGRAGGARDGADLAGMQGHSWDERHRGQYQPEQPQYPVPLGRGQ